MRASEFSYKIGQLEILPILQETITIYYLYFLKITGNNNSFSNLYNFFWKKCLKSICKYLNEIIFLDFEPRETGDYTYCESKNMLVLVAQQANKQQIVYMFGKGNIKW